MVSGNQKVTESIETIILNRYFMDLIFMILMVYLSNWMRKEVVSYKFYREQWIQ